MTPEERAWKLIDEYKEVMGRSFYGAGSMHPRIVAVIREAVAAERERCAQIADAIAVDDGRFDFMYSQFGAKRARQIATEIRKG